MFYIFAHDTYYPSGGWYDFKERTGTLEEAKKVVSEWTYPYDTVQIVFLAPDQPIVVWERDGDDWELVSY